MLVAEIHGKSVPEALNSEDYLTSTIFGHLRYLAGLDFWCELFKHALSMPGVASKTLAEYFVCRGIPFDSLESVDVRFWPSHPNYGSPDLILVFTFQSGDPFVLLIEAKLWATKSGTGEFDQITRYLRLLDHPRAVKPVLPHKFYSAVVYLTEHDSLAELEESVSEYHEDRQGARERIFRLQWQDILVSACQMLPTATGITKMILHDVAKFLSGRGLEYFDGFYRMAIPVINTRGIGCFLGRTELPLEFHVRKAGWIR